MRLKGVRGGDIHSKAGLSNCSRVAPNVKTQKHDK